MGLSPEVNLESFFFIGIILVFNFASKISSDEASLMLCVAAALLEAAFHQK